MARFEIKRETKKTALDVDGNTVRVGDRLLCIDDAASFRRLAVGHEYVASAAYDGSPTVEISGSYHAMERFRRVA